MHERHTPPPANVVLLGKAPDGTNLYRWNEGERSFELLLGRDLSNFPEPDDFVYCYVDADIKDEPVTSLDEANSAIAAIKKL